MDLALVGAGWLLGAAARREALDGLYFGMAWLRLFLTLTARALVNPFLAVDLLRVAWRFRHRHWYRRFPFLPLPATTYVKWRMYTAYGEDDAIPPAEDVITFARWVGRQP
jgi:hypothetical protein